MKRLVVFGIAAVVALALGMGMGALSSGPDIAASGLRVEKLFIQTQAGKTHDFNVEIADTPVSLQVGLMFRKSMAEDHGMLFQMGKDPQPAGFWMKNTFISLDMLFVAKDGTIAKIASRTVPESLESISSGAPVTAVLELNGGTAEKLGITAGDRVIHPYFE